MDAADDGDDGDDDDEEGEMMTLYQPEISSRGGGSGGTRGGSNLGLPGGKGVNWKVSTFPMVLLPAYSLLKQEQLR